VVGGHSTVPASADRRDGDPLLRRLHRGPGHRARHAAAAHGGGDHRLRPGVGPAAVPRRPGGGQSLDLRRAHRQRLADRPADDAPPGREPPQQHRHPGLAGGGEHPLPQTRPGRRPAGGPLHRPGGRALGQPADPREGPRANGAHRRGRRRRLPDGRVGSDRPAPQFV